MIINEKEMISILSYKRHIALIEPPYKRLWMSLGLAKIAAFCKQFTSKISFSRSVPVDESIDLIVITSLFTYDYSKVVDTISMCLLLHPHTPIIIGGVAATLGAHKFEKLFPSIFIFKGVSKTLDVCVPDYSIDWELNKKYQKACWVFTQRGCPNSCTYCAVPRIEKEMWINPNWKNHIIENKELIIVCDNNLSAAPEEHQKAVISHLAASGKFVDFNAGIDVKHVTTELAELLSGVKFQGAGLKLAFDRIEEDGIFQEAVETLVSAGVNRSAIQAYLLFNFRDSPQEAYYRGSECRRLKITPYPQQYAPLNKWDKKNKYIGKHWTLNLARAFRAYWLSRGIFNHISFEEYIKGNLGEKKVFTPVTITNYDIQKWENGECNVYTT